MKKISLINNVVLSALLVLLMSYCQKDDDEGNNQNISVPTVVSAPISDIAFTSATGGGEITDDGGSPVTSRGVCWSMGQTPYVEWCTKTTDGFGNGKFTSKITGLSNHTGYQLRAYATNRAGTGYGDLISFSTLRPVAATDVDGNQYYSIVLNRREWLIQNLKTTHYRNGDPIQNPGTNQEWTSLSAGAYCWYNNDVSNKDQYGALYNWYAVSDSRKLAPEGWHIASEVEWKELIMSHGGNEIVFMYLKNTEFTKTPGGLWGGWRDGKTGMMQGLSTYSFWWSSGSPVVMGNNGYGYALSIVSKDTIPKTTGCSVRCIKDY